MDSDFQYMKQSGLPVVIEALLARIAKDRPTDLLTHISATAFSVKVEEQAKQFRNAWPDGSVSAEDRRLLDTLDFKPHDYTDSELLLFLEVIFERVCADLQISPDPLRRLLLVVSANYSPAVPFHNFKHAFAVCQHAHVLMKMCGLYKRLEPVEALALLISCVCHDMGHPGLNNAYQKNAVTPLAIRYNDQSVLENYHCSCTFDVLSVPECDIMGSFESTQAKRSFRDLVIQLILATDVSKHKMHMLELKSLLDTDGVDWADKSHRVTVLKNFMMMGDLNNEAKSFEQSRVWAPLVQEEFYRQGDLERSEGLPVAPMMERTAKVEVEQQGFIKYLCLPLYEINARLHPELKVCVDNLNRNATSWAALA